MHESELKILAATGFTSIAAGATWLLGAWVLIIAGLLLLIGTVLIPVKEE